MAKPATSAYGTPTTAAAHTFTGNNRHRGQSAAAAIARSLTARTANAPATPLPAFNTFVVRFTANYTRLRAGKQGNPEISGCPGAAARLQLAHD